MIKNYLTVAIRNIARNKTFSAINILGLAIGMACCILILLYVQDELSYDQHHEHAHRIYRLSEEAYIAGQCIELQLRHSRWDRLSFKIIPPS